MTRQPTASRLRVLRTGDPQSMFHYHNPKEILERLGPPWRLLSSSAKTEKSRGVGVLSRVLYLTPGVFCPRATEGCLRVCLGHASGRMTMLQSANARDRRTALYAEDQEHFLDLLRCDLRLLREDARREGMTPAVRLNGTSDIPWETLHGELFAEFDDLEFYDYTKVPSRVRQFLLGRRGLSDFPANYHLTFSHSETNAAEARSLLDEGAGVAVVFWPSLPETYGTFPVVDADKHDARFLDDEQVPTRGGYIVGLRAKGIAREDLSGFVVQRAGEPVYLKRGAAA
ncbi:GP88 family protein [Botrimarina mediterranea]|nr:hypothetical protein [Botrimarina mediterranea]QDV79196.1 hypothetical protein K2D_28070 [Planctomycetes bacterium K2D]